MLPEPVPRHDAGVTRGEPHPYGDQKYQRAAEAVASQVAASFIPARSPPRAAPAARDAARRSRRTLPKARRTPPAGRSHQVLRALRDEPDRRPAGQEAPHELGHQPVVEERAHGHESRVVDQHPRSRSRVVSFTVPANRTSARSRTSLPRICYNRLGMNDLHSSAK